jgi:hypothetical protein
VALSLNTSALETTLNNVYPQLGTANSFTDGANFGGAISAASSSSGTPAISGAGTNGAAGISGSSDTGTGGSFSNSSSTNPTVYATNSATCGTPIGLKGLVTGNDGNGVVADETGIGGYGLAAHATGVYDGDRGFAAGVYALGNNGYVVLGIDGGASTLGTNFADAYGAAGVWGDTNVPYTSSAFTSLAGVAGTAENNYGGYFANDSSSVLAATVYIENNSTTSGALVFQAVGNVGTALNSCTIDGSSNLSCLGTVSNVVPAASGRHVETFASRALVSRAFIGCTWIVPLGLPHR